MLKPENTTSTNAIRLDDATRCQRRRPSGRRCKLPVMAPGASFCLTHTQEFNKADTLNLKTPLLANHEGFQTAQGINNSLGNLYILLANNYISPRRAAVLAYINSLLLRTLPAIDADNAAGITDPTAPEPIPAESVPPPSADLSQAAVSPAPHSESNPNVAAESGSAAKADSITAAKSDLGSSAKSDAPAIPLEDSAAPDAPQTHEPATPSKYRSYWDTLPDPTKKPS